MAIVAKAKHTKTLWNASSVVQNYWRRKVKKRSMYLITTEACMRGIIIHLLEYWEIDLLNTFGIASGQAMVTHTMGAEHQAVPSKITPHSLLLFIKYESQEKPITPSVGEMAWWKFKFVHSIFHEVFC